MKGKSRIFIITNCTQCYYYESFANDWAGMCPKLNREIEESRDDGEALIPDDCPLERAESDVARR